MQKSQKLIWYTLHFKFRIATKSGRWEQKPDDNLNHTYYRIMVIKLQLDTMVPRQLNPRLIVGGSIVAGSSWISDLTLMPYKPRGNRKKAKSSA